MDNDIHPPSEITVPAVVTQAPTLPTPKKKNQIGWITAKIAAIALWTYVILKLFVFDVDRDAMSYLAPSYLWLLKFKLIGVLAVAALTLIFAWKWGGWLKIGYILFYPIIFVGWKIPYWLFRQRSWPLAIALVNAITSFVGSLRYTALMLTAFLVAAGLALFTTNKLLLWLSVATILCLLVIAYARRLISVFRPSAVFRAYEKIVNELPKLRSTTCRLEDQIKNVPYDGLTPEQATKWKNTLQTSFVLSRFYLFVARKFRDYGRSGYGKITSVLIFLFLVSITALAFSLVNLSLYEIDPTYFKATRLPTLFTFLDYSFNRVIFQSIPDLIPIEVISKVAYDLEALFSLFLVGILVSLLVSTRSEKQAQELNETVVKLEDESGAMERAIMAEYRFATADEALAALKKLEASSVEFIDKMLPKR